MAEQQQIRKEVLKEQQRLTQYQKCRISDNMDALDIRYLEDLKAYR